MGHGDVFAGLQANRSGYRRFLPSLRQESSERSGRRAAGPVCQRPHPSEEESMSWTTPKVIEISVGMEINSYACADL